MTPRDEQLLAGLLSALAGKARAHLARAEAAGIPMRLISGRRTPREQLDLYAKGRELREGVWVVTAPELVITRALPDQSPHCAGAAYDAAPVGPGGQVLWERLDLFEQLGQLGQDVGLVWGGSWPRFRDMPHFELRRWRSLPAVTSTTTT